MPVSLLKPLTVSAKVILSEVSVPSLGGGVFNRDTTLEKGIHVHWALPDHLTRARLLPKGGKNVAVFPGVPDVWLVIRFNPGPPIEQIAAKRSWRAWVVDSVAETAVPLNSWTAPAARDPNLVHTIAGLLPSGKNIGYPGRGIWENSQGAFDPAIAAYYPSSRKRFGFHDDVSDLTGTGNVSYVVIGWHADRNYDPLYMAKDKLGLLNEWKIGHHLRPNAYAEVNTAAPMAAAQLTPPRFEVRQIGVKEIAMAPGQDLDFTRAAARGGTQQAMSAQTEMMRKNFPVAASASEIPLDVAVGYLGPTDSILHGSCVEVPLKGASTAGVPIADKDIRLFPSVRRAMAEIAAMNVGSPTQVDAVEMMLDDLESMKSSVSGVLDMPGMAHAATFQNVPGKSQWYARLEIQPNLPLWQAATQFAVSAVEMSPKFKTTGYWPKMEIRSASNKLDWMVQAYPDAVIQHPPVSAQQPQPTVQQLEQWRADVTSAFNATVTAAQGDGRQVEPNLLQVIDRRSKAQSSVMSRMAGKTGSDGAGWWVDISDPKSLDELYRCAMGAKVVMPNKSNLLEVPGPRWNRPWAPQVALFGTGRSYKFGFDGRFRADGYMKTRLSGEVVLGLSVGANARVLGKDVIEKPNELFSKPGIPADARALVQEAMLMDTENSGIMANLSGRRRDPAAAQIAQKQMKSAVRGLWLSRDQGLVAARKPNLQAVATFGTFPSDVAVSPWQDPRDPLFVDVDYTHPRSAVQQNWLLDQDAVETRAAGPEATNPPAGQVEIVQERTKVTASVVNVLESTMVTKKTLDVTAHLTLAQKPPKNVKPDTFKQLDVLSAPLTALDATLTSRSHRERTGALRLNRLQLVDMYGLAREWNSGKDPASPDGSSELSYWTELHPRLPYWARMLFRLQQADNVNQEAHPLAPPVCGVLVPDFIEHALEIFDGNGKAIGQLNTDRPRFGGGPASPAVTLNVTFSLHPWVAAELGLPANSLDGIANQPLKSMVASLLAQSMEIPAEASTTDWYETGLSAMLRSIDTVRATLDPSKKTDVKDKRVKLLGEPILVLAARVSYQGTLSTSPTEIAGDPPLLNQPPAMPVIPVRIGDATRPDDGVLGCFVAGATPADGRFCPVTKEAAKKAILNGLGMGVPFFAHNGLEAKHPFVFEQECLFPVPANTEKDLVILADPRGGLYATCGMLPRKKITMPREFLEAALRNIEPSFRVGPLFTTTAMGAVKALAPPPEIDGLKAEYVYRQPGENGGPVTYPEVSVPPTPPIAELPKDRVTLTDGWMRVYKPPEN